MGENDTVVRAAEGGDGLKRWRLLRRPHGLYLYEEMTLQDEVYLVDEAGNSGALVAEAYWMATHVSGLFSSDSAAQEDAVATLPWLTSALAIEEPNGS